MTTYRDTDNKMFLTIPSVYGYNRADWKIVTPHSTYYPGTHSGHLIFPPDLPIFEPAVYWDTTIFNPFVSASGTFSGDLRDIWSWSSSSSLVGVVSTMASLLLVPPRDVSNPRLSGEFYLHVIRGDLQELDREDDTSMRQMTNFFSRAFNRHDNVTQDRQQSDVSEMLDLTDLQPIHEYHRQSSSDAIECFINKVLVPKCHIELPVSVNGKSHTEYFAGVVTYHDWIQGELEWAKLLIKKSPRMVTYIPSDHQANRNKWYEM
jgi:ubiquitin-protein ligase